MLSEDQTRDREIELYFTTNLFKPTLSLVSLVELVTIDDQVIQIELLHRVEVKMGEYIWQISGFSYEIFACPQK